MRLGLVLAEIGESAKVQVSDEELSQALVERARQFPGQEKMVWDFYRKNPQALAEIRAPLFEDKVVDHILASATVTEKAVSKEELLDESDGEEKARARRPTSRPRSRGPANPPQRPPKRRPSERRGSIRAPFRVTLRASRP